MNKLKELVSKGIEGIPSTNEVGTIYKCTLGKWRVCIHTKQGAEHVYSVPDLINDDDFMALIYGKRTVCPVCGAKEGLTPSTRPDVWWCKDSCPGSVKLINRYKYIQQQAIILSGDAQVKYLHKMMMK